MLLHKLSRALYRRSLAIGPLHPFSLIRVAVLVTLAVLVAPLRQGP